MNQHLIACGVTVGIVNRLKVIQVKGYDGHGAVSAPLYHVGQLRLQIAPVADARQLIVGSALAELLILLTQLLRQLSQGLLAVL
ncbi:hypothetical protein SDC9_104598 [bioreactor metagenome]|uniref:Uncharacterized protein n=1 Tax=bioreactor metagenome TaxID=1076179 RepID=A0A645AX09_9ZZZZ